MDCEKFEAAMMDELYGELDELTSAAMKRHMAGCARCAALFGGLKATRRLAGIAPVATPEGLEERILAATRDVPRVIPLRRRLASAVSLAGGWAMRPQTAMAAVFLVMIGTSVLLLSGRASRAPASSAITVTEQGSPTPELTAMASASAAPGFASPLGQIVAATPPPPPAASALARSDIPRDEGLHGATRSSPPSAPAKDDLADLSAANEAQTAPTATSSPSQPATGGAGGYGDLDRGMGAEKKGVSPFNAAVQLYQAGSYDSATKAFDALAPGDATAELWAARSVRESKGCRAALARFDHVAQRAAGSAPAWDALLEGALCYRSIGRFNDARTRLTALLGVDSHKDRARAELDRLNQLQSGQGGGAGPAAAAKAPAAAPAPAPPPPPARPPATAVDTGF
jgi:hypothetical protein